MTSNDKITKEDLHSFLRDNSTSNKFYIEYNEFLSNHLAHAAVALYYLGDTRKHFEEYLHQYIDMKLEVKDGKTSKEQNSSDTGDVAQLVGKRQNYYQLMEHYRKIYEGTYGKSTAALLKNEFPKLSSGLICSALHPLIHIGYGLDVDFDDMVIEGMAYLHHSHVGPVYAESKPDFSKLGKGDVGILDVLKQLREDKELIDFKTSRGAEIRKELNCHRKVFQTDAMALLEKGDHFAKLILSIKMPDFKTPAEAASWALDQAITAFQASVKINDFFLVHGVTSAWSLSRIIPHLDAADATEALFYYLNALLIAYVCQNCPDMDLKRLENDEETKKLTWPEICKMALDMPLDTTDEHVFKLIQVCQDQKGKSENKGMDVICKRAALTTMSKPFFT